MRATGGEALGRSTLGWLVAQLGPRVTRIECAPAGLEVVVREPVIYDVLVPPATEPGDVVLAIGVGADSADAVDLYRWAAGREAGAAVFKVGEVVPPRLVAAAEEASVALVTVPLETAWDQLYALIRRVMATSADLPSGEDTAPVGDVFALANAIAAMVGGAVVINDPQLQVIAYSSLDDPIDDTRQRSILGRRPPDDVVRRLREEGTFSQLLHSPEAIRMPGWTGDRPRIAIAIRAGKEVLGFIFVAEGKAPLGDGARLTLLEASRIAALHLLRLRSSTDLERRLRSDLLRGVLEGRGSIDLLASRLGLKPTGVFTIVGFELDFADSDEEEDDTDEERLRQERVRDLILLQSEALRRRASTVSMGRRIYALLPGSEPLPATRLLQWAEDVIEHAHGAFRVELKAGIGSTVNHLSQVVQSRHDADQVLRILRIESQLVGRQVATIDQVRGHAFLLELQETAALQPHLQYGKVAALVRYDAENGTAYVESLRAYLDALGDVVIASKRIHVHRNTLRYRLRRLCELVDLDVTDPTDRLVAELQLRLLEPGT
jgi:PucR C-terminal helix-turn-helix domain/GGDEF-like domain